MWTCRIPRSRRPGTADASRGWTGVDRRERGPSQAPVLAERQHVVAVGDRVEHRGHVVRLLVQAGAGHTDSVPCDDVARAANLIPSRTGVGTGGAWPCCCTAGPLEGADDIDRNRIRALLARHGQVDSPGYFATRNDKSYIFSPTGKAAVAYRVMAGVCLAAGDPIGDIEAWPGAIEARLQLTQQRAWIPAVLAASETGPRPTTAPVLTPWRLATRRW
jgi:hypothetical protein